MTSCGGSNQFLFIPLTGLNTKNYKRTIQHSKGQISFFFYIKNHFKYPRKMATPTLAHFKLPQIDNEPMVIFTIIIYAFLKSNQFTFTAQLRSWFR
jgi:hypothetical protein